MDFFCAKISKKQVFNSADMMQGSDIEFYELMNNTVIIMSIQFCTFRKYNALQHMKIKDIQM